VARAPTRRTPYARSGGAGRPRRKCAIALRRRSSDLLKSQRSTGSWFWAKLRKHAQPIQSVDSIGSSRPSFMVRRLGRGRWRRRVRVGRPAAVRSLYRSIARRDWPRRDRWPYQDTMDVGEVDADAPSLGMVTSETKVNRACLRGICKRLLRPLPACASVSFHVAYGTLQTCEARQANFANRISLPRARASFPTRGDCARTVAGQSCSEWLVAAPRLADGWAPSRRTGCEYDSQC